MQAKRLRSKSN